MSHPWSHSRLKRSLSNLIWVMSLIIPGRWAGWLSKVPSNPTHSRVPEDTCRDMWQPKAWWSKTFHWHSLWRGKWWGHLPFPKRCVGGTPPFELRTHSLGAPSPCPWCGSWLPWWGDKSRALLLSA